MMNIPKEIQKLCKQDSVKRNIRIHFPNGERPDITNNEIEGENFSFTENLCSKRELKFGLCEANVVKFTCVGVGNISGCEIEVFHELDVSSLMGTDTHNFDSVDKKIEVDVSVLKPGMPVEIVFSNAVASLSYLIKYEDGNMEISTYNNLDGPYSGFELTLSSEHGNVVSFTITVPVNVSAVLEVPRDLGFEYLESEDVVFPYYQIPLGVFVVDQCKRSKGHFERRKVVAYSKELSLENVSDAEKIKRKYFIGKTYEFDIPNYMISNSLLDNPDNFSYSSMELKEGSIAINYANVWIKDNCYLRAIEHYKTCNFTTEQAQNVYRITNNVVKNGTPARLSEYLDALYATLDELGYSVQSANRNAFNSFVGKEIYPFFGPFYANHLKDDSKYLYPLYSSYLRIPYKLEFYVYDTDASETKYTDEFIVTDEEIAVELATTGYPSMYYSIGEYDGSDIDFKQIFEAYAELQGKFGRCDRSGIFELEGINKKFGLYPGNGLYPGSNLYPSSAGCLITESMMLNSPWYNDETAKPFGKIKAIYTDTEDVVHEIEHLIPKGMDSEGKELYYEESECSVYDLTKNEILQNGKFEESEVTALLETLAENIKDIVYRPADVEMKGQPYLECGDVLRIRSESESFQTVILRRTLKGVQTLKDSIQSE